MPQIVKLRIKNFMSIADVEIEPGKINQIVGQNNQAKTTVLKALKACLKGGADPSMVKMGEDAAEVVVELSDQTMVRRRISSNGNQSVSVKREGMAASAPQTFLDGMFDEFSFNPIELLDPKKRNDAIMAAIDLRVSAEQLAKELGCSELDLPPLDYDQHGLKVVESAKKYFYQRRAEANKDALEKKNRWETYQKDFKAISEPDFDQVTVDRHRRVVNDEISLKKQELVRIQASHAAAKKAQETLDRYRAAVDDIDDEIAKQESHLKALRARREEGMKFVEDAERQIPDALESDSVARQALENLAKQNAELDLMEKDLKLYLENKKQSEMIGGLESDWKKAEKFAKAIDDRVKNLHGPLKQKLLSEVEMPIEGLSFDDGVFTVDGVPVENLSSSRALKLAINVARKLANKTKIICIDGAELLDAETFEEFAKETSDDGFVYFLTKVGDAFPGGDKVFKMEKGAVIQ